MVDTSSLGLALTRAVTTSDAPTRTLTRGGGSIRVRRVRVSESLDQRTAAPSSSTTLRAPTTPAAGLPSGAVAEPTGTSWLEHLAQGFNPSTSIWGEAGRNAYMTNRATEVMRNLSRPQVEQLLRSCRNEAERASLNNAFAGGPASGYAREWLLSNHFGGDQTRMNQWINYWNHINPACCPNFDPVRGEFKYTDDRWDLDRATYTTPLSEFWMGEGLGTKSRPLGGFAAVIAGAVA